MFCSVFTKNCLKGLGGASTVWRFKGQLGEEERGVFLSVCVCVCVCVCVYVGGGYHYEYLDVTLLLLILIYFQFLLKQSFPRFVIGMLSNPNLRPERCAGD